MYLRTYMHPSIPADGRRRRRRCEMPTSKGVSSVLSSCAGKQLLPANPRSPPTTEASASQPSNQINQSITQSLSHSIPSIVNSTKTASAQAESKRKQGGGIGKPQQGQEKKENQPKQASRSKKQCKKDTALVYTAPTLNQSSHQSINQSSKGREAGIRRCERKRGHQGKRT
ncbi:uncharacterized protein K452DRAFT_47635 [Aplosporella prunicola CBS 121167]|uniref:Uncharacterized protein n=1 Tax=Aplosporella prunicola CBS 121167 TaxID=1176127 RepID=A0A6A6BB99_9PEZI|nr:uncharacterized protein K452DRAFT_47635 [Aplosporella prunicola CBS 121167]KAF2140515.1 hypothetical protein K452DRAFT_47635 [Aplosporella prunicola CBS 121167]